MPPPRPPAPPPPRADAEATAALERSLLQEISDATGDVIFAKDREGRLLYVNRAALALVGKPREQVIGRTDAELLDDAEAARHVMENDRRVMERGVAEELEERVPRPDGTQAIWLSRKSPWRDAEGRVVGLLGISRDITERKAAAEALRASEERYRTLFTNMTEGFALGEAICDEAGVPRDFRFLEMNEAFEVQSGLAREKARGRPMREVLPHLEQSWVDTYCGVALGAPPLRFESSNADLDRHFSVYCFSPERGRFAIIFTDVTERRRGELAVREAIERLRDADRRKDEFLGMLSHELRNPLAPIRSSVYVLEHADPAGDQAQRARAVIKRQTEHLTRLVDDLLDLTRIARGKIELRRTRVDLREVVSRAADDFRLVMDDRGVAFRTVLPPAPLWADGDATRITQIVGNLLHNAAKFTRRGDEVLLSLAREGSEARVRVRDTGAGIEAALLPTIFDPFVQGERTLARTEGGLGLGLALVKGITELHGGAVRVESGGLGKGSEFTIALPLARASSAPAPGDASRVDRARGRRVVVVDDNADAADSLAELLRLFGHDVEVAYDGPAAIAAVRARAPDVVLCDIGLPGMDGYEVARALRAELPELQLVAVSGYAQPEDVQRALGAGFDAHVAKPPDPAELERLLG